MLTINEHIRIPRSEIEFDFVRSSGPGGQNVNKVATKAVLKWDVTRSESIPDPIKQRFLRRFKNRIGQDGVFTMTSQRYRDRSRNVTDCLNKLREFLIEAAQVPKTRKKTRPTFASRERRLKNKQRRGQKKELRRPPKFD